jgi:hypothetical protein
MIARPTVTSAAATTIIKNTKICASLANVGKAFATGLAACIFENATRSRLTEFNISSMHINMIMALRRTSTPVTPMANRTNDKAIYALISITYNFTYRPTPSVEDAGATEKISSILFLTTPLKISTAL